MVNGAFNLSSGAGEFGVQRAYPRLELTDRDTIKVLRDQLRERIGSAVEGLVGVHGRNR